MHDLYSAISEMGNSRFGRLQETVSMINKTASTHGSTFEGAANLINNLIKADDPEDGVNLDEDDHRDRLDREGDVWMYKEDVNPRCDGHWTIIEDGQGSLTLKAINDAYGPIRVINP